MALYRQGAVDQGGRIGRLEKYVYRFHGSPYPGLPTAPPPVTQPPISGSKPPISGSKPGDVGTVPPLVPIGTPILSGGSVPFGGKQFFYKGIGIVGHEPILFQDHKNPQTIEGIGKSKNGRWKIGKLDGSVDTLSMHNDMHGSVGARIDLDRHGLATISDNLLIKDRRVGGGKDTIVLDAGLVSNVGINFAEDGIPVWDIYKTGKNNLEIGYTDAKKDLYHKSFSIDTKGFATFEKAPKSKEEPTTDEDLVNLKFFNDHIASSGASVGPSTDFTKPIKVKDSIEIYGPGNGDLKFTSNASQKISGGKGANKWSIGKDSASDNLVLHTDIGGKETSISVGENGKINTTGYLNVGKGLGDAEIKLTSNLKTDKLGIDLVDASGSMAGVHVEGRDLIVKSKGDIVFDTTENLYVNKGAAHEKIITTENGPTRPNTNVVVGQQFFDTILKKPIWASSISPTVWVNAMGTIV